MSKQTGQAIQTCIAAGLTDFNRADVRPGHWFRRHVPPLYNFVVILHSTKYRCFEVDVVSTVFASWDRQYGSHQLRRATGLPNLRVGSSSMLMEEVSYNYKDDPAHALAIISNELRLFAAPWFAAHRREMANDQLVQCGLELMEGRANTPIDLAALKHHLRQEADQVIATKWQRRETAILAVDLMRWRQELRR